MTEELALRLQAAPVATFRTRARLRTRCSCVTPQRSKEGVRQKRRSYRDPDDDDDVGEDLAAVNERLDALTRQLERMAHGNAERRAAAAPAASPAAPDRVAEALARLD